MSAAAKPALHRLIVAASDGVLPQWARVSEARRAHIERVSALLDLWAQGLALPDRERRRWRAVGYLHDSLKDAASEELRRWLKPPLSELPDPLLHGPAAAARLADDGVDDAELLDALRYHTLGHENLGPVGRALFAADFLEPGRELRDEWRRELRQRMPDEIDAVVKEILQARVVYLVGEGRPVRAETMGFWNAMAGGKPWARASEV